MSDTKRMVNMDFGSSSRYGSDDYAIFAILYSSIKCFCNIM